MPSLSRADHRVSPPILDIPRDYNAAHDLITRNLDAGRGAKPAYIDDAGSYTYDVLEARSNRVANVLRAQGLQREERLLVCMLDTFDLPCVFLGAIKAGIVPVLVNTLLTPGDYEYLLGDCRARVAVVSAPLVGQVAPSLGRVATLEQLIVAGDGPAEHPRLDVLLEAAVPTTEIAATVADEPCFWLYSSGSTGKPKGTVHVHSSLVETAELYGRGVLGVTSGDLVFSAAKIFFAYGLGNALSFPLAAGATTLLMAERPTPEAVFKRLRDYRPSIFYGVPTLFASMLAHPDLPRAEELDLRRCSSAGEALPEEIARRWEAHFSLPILDGIGSTEMLHIFLSNRPGDVRHGTTGKPVPGYEVRILDDRGQPVAPGETGELQVAGPSAALMYWNNRARSRQTFQGPWTRTGDKYRQDADGYYVYAGRSDDMLKVGGIYVSPFEVESALMSHEAVLEVAVIGRADETELVKPAAFVVLKDGYAATSELGRALQAHVKSRLAPYKYPRWIAFVDTLPKTATGKIQRYKLRETGYAAEFVTGAGV
ncbi:MAG: benzoate-CoA ligase family protein [Gammaproteobacteria bacterium]|nr:benzoate-CoA ligase family protein [Gammaproteobacteria bacterium]